VTFAKEDIGGEVLAILTTGLYRDPLDTLREYIQNAIDAESEDIEVVITPDAISVADSGMGMNGEQAKRAIRLGISDKNPLESVGFRGIGLYSAFNLCDRLAIHTRSEGDPHGYRISIDFASMREELLKEQQRRKRKEPPSLYLEKLLESAVHVDVDETDVVPGHGTKAILSGLLGEVYKRLNDWDQVVSYLENVVPLPFHPDFKHAAVIEKRLKDEAQRIVPVTLQVLVRREPIYRPYRNDIFSGGGKHPPKFITVSDGKQTFGIAWVCINDARKVLSSQALRGLLIKKLGFSIANRSFLEPFFKRPVFNRRITGEVIVRHDELIPNAARSDFEHNSTRQAFMIALGKLVQEVSSWGDRIQQDDKAREVLERVRHRVTEINRALPGLDRDSERLLHLNVELHGLSEDLRPHAKTLKAIDDRSYASTRELLKECQDLVEGLLVKRKQGQKELEKRIVRSIQREAAAQKEGPTEDTSPKDLIALLESFDLQTTDEHKELLRYMDETILRVRLTAEEYKDMLTTLREFLDDRS
jgi:hypothetical protein